MRGACGDKSMHIVSVPFMRTVSLRASGVPGHEEKPPKNTNGRGIFPKHEENHRNQEDSFLAARKPG